MTSEVQAAATYGPHSAADPFAITVNLKLDASEFLEGLAHAAAAFESSKGVFGEAGPEMLFDRATPMTDTCAPQPRGMLIGLAGRKGAGKDTAAAALSRRGFSVRRFADPLKGMLRTLFEYQGYGDCTIDAMIEGALKEQPIPSLNGRSPRHAMQTLGTEWGRGQIGGDLWVETLIGDVGPSARVVVPDVRFPNELAAIREAGGVVIWIERPGLKGADAHASENAIGAMDCDGQLTNAYTSADAFRDNAGLYFDVLLTKWGLDGRDS